MPAAPERILVLCCARLSAFDVQLHAREAEWAPTRCFQVNADGHRVQVGWRGEWSCNLCGRSLAEDDPSAHPSPDDPLIPYVAQLMVHGPWLSI